MTITIYRSISRAGVIPCAFSPESCSNGLLRFAGVGLAFQPSRNEKLFKATMNRKAQNF